MKSVTTFDNFPTFAENGSRNMNTESAKYQIGFVEADTFPAEWANYLFHGATKGISDLNTAVQSIWQENINVITQSGQTPNPNSTNQLYTAIQMFISNAILQAEKKFYIEVTWAELKTLRDSNSLVKGVQYRITDYVTTTAQTNTESANHAFDLIVFADSTNTINENARAIQHNGDSYFHEAKLNAWKIKYSLDNDSSRFAWASPTGKGVIWFMQDEHGNVAPYDFKNIKFKRYKITNTQSGYPNFTNRYYAVATAMTGYSVDSSNFRYFYTFSNGNTTSDIDISLKGINFVGDFEEDWWSQQCLNNVIMPYFKPIDNTVKQFLNDIVILEQSWNSSEDSDCSSNIFGSDCYSNTFGSNCYSNTFGSDCHSNTFGSDCYSNTFGSDCYSNTFGSYYRFFEMENSCYYLNFVNSGSGSSYIQKVRVCVGTQGKYSTPFQISLNPNFIKPQQLQQVGPSDWSCGEF